MKLRCQEDVPVLREGYYESYGFEVKGRPDW